MIDNFDLSRVAMLKWFRDFKPKDTVSLPKKRKGTTYEACEISFHKNIIGCQRIRRHLEW